MSWVNLNNIVLSYKKEFHTNPEDFWEDWHKGTECLELGLPWLVPGAINHLDDILTPDMNVLEFGSGGSTLFFANRCNSVVSFETNRKWYDMVTDRIFDMNTHAHLDRQMLNIEEFTNMIMNFPSSYKMSKKFDVVLFDTDSTYDEVMTRGIMASLVLHSSLLAKNPIIIMDNYYQVQNVISDLSRPGWEGYSYNDPHWVGQGTLIARKVST